MRQYKFMRACYGMCVCTAIGVIVTLLTRPEPFEAQRGLVWGTVADALRRFKGSPGIETVKRTAWALPTPTAERAVASDGSERPLVRISRPLADSLAANTGDFLYVTDTRWWLGGLRSTHAVVGEIVDSPDGQSRIELDPATFATVVTRRRAGNPLRVERLY
jgi:SSS family solute:Na+ symporter